MASSSHRPHPPPPALPSQPSDIELAKMLSASPAGNNSLIIHEADVCGQDPADLTQQFTPAVAEDGQRVWYFSTKLEPKSHCGKRKRRCTRSGVWHDEGKFKDIASEGRAIGHRRLFSFVKKVDGKKDRTGWIMHEFRLLVPDGNEEESPVVLCKVFRSSRWCAPPNPAISGAGDQVQAQTEFEVVEEEEALVKAVEAREAAVKVREKASAAREAAVEAREALARRDAANLAVSERNLQEQQSNLAAREAAMEAREALARRDAERNLQDRQSNLAVEAELAAMEVEEGEAIARGDTPLHPAVSSRVVPPVQEVLAELLAMRRSQAELAKLQARFRAELAARQAAIEVEEGEALALARGDTPLHLAMSSSRQELLQAVKARLATSQDTLAALQAREAALQAREVQAREVAAWQREVEGGALVRGIPWLGPFHLALPSREEELAAEAGRGATFALTRLWQFLEELAATLQVREFRALRALAESERAELEREAELREAEGEGLARRDAARLAMMERNLQEQERNLAAREAAFESRLQALQEELSAELEALVLILMVAAALVTRAGLLLPISCGSRAAAVARCGGELEPLF